MSNLVDTLTSPQTALGGQLLGLPDNINLLDLLPAAIYTTDAEGRITYYNEAAAVLWGCRPALNSAHWCGSWRLFRPDGTPLPHDECPMAVALKENRPIRGVEAIAERPDGTRVPFIPFPTPLHDAAGRLIGGVNMLVDITDRKKAEALAQKFAAIVESSNDAVISKDLDGIITSWNKGAERLYGYTAEEIIGKPFTILIPPDHLDEEPRILARIQRGERTDHYETIRVRKDGSLVDISLTVSPVKDAQGKIIGASKIARDITERKRVAEITERLAAIVESSDDAVVSKNLDGIITSWNKGAERLFGYFAEEVIGKPVTILIPPSHINEEATILNRVRRGQRIDHYETVRQGKRGNLIDISLTVSPIKDSRGKIIGASKTARNITERKRHEAQITILAREAEHRAKNLLSTVQATVHLSQAATVEDLKKAIEGRIQALANVHALFVQSRWEGAELQNLVTQELSPYAHGSDTRVRIAGPNLLLEPNAAQALALTLHELATNAAKYGALTLPEGQVQVQWARSSNGRLNLCWTEVGGPPVQSPTRQGFGTRLMERMIGGQLTGEIRCNWRTEGLVCEISIPA